MEPQMKTNIVKYSGCEAAEIRSNSVEHSSSELEEIPEYSRERSLSSVDGNNSVHTDPRSVLSSDSNWETWIDLLSETEMEELEETVLEMIEEYMYGQIAKMSDPKFSKLMCDDITAYLFGIWVDTNICLDSDEDYVEVGRFISNTYDKYMSEYSIIPPRQCDIYDVCIPFDPSDSLDRLANIPQPKQRTKDWYENRYQMLTASNISKALGSDSQRNSLIYEKCKPLVMENQFNYVNTESSMHWGVKYEPISAAIYEDIFSAKLSDYGCIPHAKYPFIGASPDGIITDPNHPRYGHMVEIKNIVNRDITGIPKEEYWIQMQVQLETCNLQYCDFVETRIKEYADVEEYYADSTHKYKGVVLYFVKKMLVANALPEAGPEYTGAPNAPHYEYMPICVDIADTDQWIYDKKAELKEEYVLYRANYWYLDTISCVLVKRNIEWFNTVVPSFTTIWETIEKERISGYAHRATVKKTKSVVGDNSIVGVNESSNSQFIRNIQTTTGGGVCLIKLDEAGNSLQGQTFL